jgi:hypothetical protein
VTEPLPTGDSELLATAVTNAIAEWVSALPPIDADQPQPAHLTFTGTTTATTVSLDQVRLSALWRMVRAAHTANLARAARVARIKAMAEILVTARREEPDADIGWIISGALNVAAERLFRPWFLVGGRPGSWESTVVETMVKAGDGMVYGDPETRDLGARLADLFVEMGNTVNTGAPEDGGDTLAQVIAFAADRLGSMAEFVGASEWGDVLSALGSMHTSAADSGGGGR